MSGCHGVKFGSEHHDFYARLRPQTHRSSRRLLPVLAAAVGVAVGFVVDALAELFLLGEGWQTTFKEGVYLLSFILVMSGGVVLGGILLVTAERDGDGPRAWRAAAVFVASSVLAALLFWGAV